MRDLVATLHAMCDIIVPALQQAHFHPRQVTATGISRISQKLPKLKVWPSPAREAVRVQKILVLSEAMLKHAEAELVIAENDFKFYDPQLKVLNPKLAEVRKKADTIRKAYDAARRPTDEARRKKDELTRQHKDALRRAEAKPEDEALKKTTADLAAKLKEAEQQYATQAKDFEAKKTADDAAQKAKREVEEKHRRASRARRDLDLAKIEVEAAQIQGEYAKKAAKK